MTKIKEKERLQKTLNALQVKLAYMIADEQDTKTKELKGKLDELIKELKTLEVNIKERQRPINEKRNEADEAKRAEMKTRKEVQATENKYKNLADQLEQIDDKIHKEKDAERRIKEEAREVEGKIAKKEEEREKTKHKLIRHEQALKSGNMETRKADLKAKYKEADAKNREQQRKYDDLREKQGRLADEVNQHQHRLQSLEREGDTRMKFLQRYFPDEYKIKTFVDKNHTQFRGRVYGPVLMEVEVKEEDKPLIERTINESVWRSFICENDADKLTLMEWCKANRVRLNVKVVNTKMYAPPVNLDSGTAASQKLKELGLKCWASDLIQCPDAVRNQLCCWGSIEKQGVVQEQADTDGIYNLFGKTHKIGVLLSKQTRFQGKFSIYGNRSLSTSSSAIGDGGRFLCKNSNNHGDDIKKLKRALDELQKKEEKVQEQLEKTSIQVTKLKTVAADIQKEAKELSNLQSSIQKCRKALERLNDEVDMLKTQLNTDAAVERVRKTIRKLEESKMKPLLEIPTLLEMRQKAACEMVGYQHEGQTLRRQAAQMAADLEDAKRQLRAGEEEKSELIDRYKHAQSRAKDALAKAKDSGTLEEHASTIATGMERVEDPKGVQEVEAYCSSLSP